ncbi:MAG: polysaccharide biosynthesis tyrosine autokinase [Verrucomicrobiales bacterium]|nr:polysaccharide biosynthesis tyrosine autokinase [Verrucomicrobiales bacterium]
MESSDSTSRGILSAEAKVHLRHYWQVILERRWLVVLGFFFCILASSLYLLRAPKIYRATATIQIDRESEGLFSARELILNTGREQDYLQTQYKNLQSPSLFRRVVEELKLSTIPPYSEAQDVIGAVRSEVQIVPVRLTRLVDVRVENTNPDLATNIANTLANTFVLDNKSLRQQRARDAAGWMEGELKNKEIQVRDAEEKLQKYKEDHDMASLEASQNIVLQSVIQAQADYNRAQSDATAAQQIAAEVMRMVNGGTNLDAIPDVAQNVAIRELKVRLAEKEAVLQGLLSRYKEKWPTVIQARSDIESLRHSMEAESQRIYESIGNRAMIASATERRMKEMLEEKQKALLEHNRLRIEYDVLARQAEQTKSLYNSLLARYQEMEVSGANSVNNMRIVDEAPRPLVPVKPRTSVILLLGIVGGLGVGLGLAFFVNYLDDSIKSQDDIENYLNLPFLGYVPNIKAGNLHERDLHAHLHPRSSAAESFRTLRAAISLAARADKMRVFGVTSSIPSEGKSLCASNFAIVTAQSGSKTVLVDADLRRPSVHKAFQIHAPVGLADYLQDPKVQLDDITHKSDVPNLDVIACGPIPANPSELLDTPQMEKLLGELRQRYDRVVIDCPPISAVSDPLVMGAKSDGILYVMKFKKIRREHARRSVQRIQDAGIQVVGVLLNDIDFEGRDSYYYSYYYYQNQYYSHYRTEPTSKKSEASRNPTAKT